MPTSRRSVLQRSSLGALGCLLPGCATAGSPAAASRPTTEKSDAPTAAAPHPPAPLPFDPTKLPGLSERLLTSHHDNNYVGAVKKLNAARGKLADLPADASGFALRGLAQSELEFTHSVALHELYFANLAGGGSSGSKTQDLLSAHFGSRGAWEQRFVALARSLGGGSGWAILEYDLHQNAPRMYVAGDHSQGLSTGIPLLVLDMYEHSYHMDYGTAAAKYIDAFFANLHWEEVDARTEAALAIKKMLA